MDVLTTVADGAAIAVSIAAAYLFGVLTASAVRALASAGSFGLTYLARYGHGWWLYRRAEFPDMVNVSLNVVRDGALLIDTVMADRRLGEIWLNPYIAQRVRKAAASTTAEDPVVKFPEGPRERRTPLGRLWQRCCSGVQRRLIGGPVRPHRPGSGETRFTTENIYAAVYAPLISRASELVDNLPAVMMAAGLPVQRHRFVLALTYEKLSLERARHFRCMMIREESLLDLPREQPRLEQPEHGTRFRTLQAMAEQYRRSPEIFGVMNVWIPTALAVPPMLGGTGQGAAAPQAASSAELMPSRLSR